MHRLIKNGVFYALLSPLRQANLTLTRTRNTLLQHKI